MATLGLSCLGCSTGAIANDTAGPVPEAPPPFLRPASVCPEDVELLVQGLLRDLPGYANRVARRTLGTFPDDTPFGTVLLAGRAELEPLPLAALAFDALPTDATQQVFFHHARAPLYRHRRHYVRAVSLAVFSASGGWVAIDADVFSDGPG